MSWVSVLAVFGRVIGSGGYGEVHAGAGDTVHKISRGTEWCFGDECIVREAAALQVMGGLEGAIQIRGFGVWTGRPFLSLPRIWWPTLREVDLDYMEALRVWVEVAGTIMAGHERGIIHRDLTPGNVFAIPGRPLVFDYGLAYIRGQPDLPFDPEAVFGTPGSIPPEAILESQEVVTPGPEYDYFQLGTLLHWVLEGTRAVEGDSPEEVLRNTCSHEWNPIREDWREARDALLENRDVKPAMSKALSLVGVRV